MWPHDGRTRFALIWAIMDFERRLQMAHWEALDNEIKLETKGNSELAGGRTDRTVHHRALLGMCGAARWRVAWNIA